MIIETLHAHEKMGSEAGFGVGETI